MNIANKLTIARVLMIPVFMIALEAGRFELWGLSLRDARYIASAIFIVAAFTDYLDGYLARKLNLITDFGKFMDPLADKVLVAAALIYLVVFGDVAAWVVVLIFTREFIISGFRMLAASKNIVIAASIWGKLKTVAQMLMVIVLLPGFDIAWLAVFGEILVYLSVALTVISLIEYVYANREVLV